jgi:Tol biopolymer transport system component
MASGSFFKRPGVLLLLGLGVIGGLVSLAEKVLSNGASVEKRTVLADASQPRTSPAFSPDGRKLAFCTKPLGGGETAFRISVTETGAAARFTRGAGSEISPAFSPDGKKLAFLRLDDQGAQAVVVPLNAIGDAAKERVLPLGWDDKEVEAERSKDRPTRAIAWTTDGKSLVVMEPPALALLSLETGKLRPVTRPGEGLADRSPAISSDGFHLAFAMGTSEAGSEGADIYTCDLGGGGLTRLTYDNDDIRGLDWSADGREVIYAAARGGGWHLWRISAAGGSPREILSAGNDARDPAIARAGNKLAFVQAPAVESIWRKRLGAEKDGAEGDDSGGEPLIRTGAAETYPSFSPDGRQVADISNQSGQEEVWLTDVESGSRARVTNFHGARLRGVRWSPDGRTLAIGEMNGGRAIFTVAASARNGYPAPLRLASGSNASFSHDGKSIYYEAGGTIFKARTDGSGAKVLAGAPANGPEESADGQSVFFRRGRSIWRVPSAGGNAEEAIEPEHFLFGAVFAAVPGGLYYLEFNRNFREVDLAFYRYSDSKARKVLRTSGTDGSFGEGFTVSTDAKTVLYAKVDRGQTNLALVESFR